jgi:hypothetical protein
MIRGTAPFESKPLRARDTGAGRIRTLQRGFEGEENARLKTPRMPK